MTKEEFKKVITNQRFDDYLNYGICILFIAGGSLLLYKMIENANKNSEYLALIFPVYLIFLGMYGIWRIPKDYVVTIIESTKSIPQKDNVVDGFLEVSKGHKQIINNNFYQITYTNKYWNSVNVYIFFDEEKFYFNARSAAVRGVIDFGLTRRANKKIKKFIEVNA